MSGTKHDQHDDKGQFARSPVGKPGGRRTEEDKLTAQVKFRTTPSHERRTLVLFHDHRKEFNWQVPSDMYREMSEFSTSHFEGLAKNPSPEMLANKRREEMLNKISNRAYRHASFEREIDAVESAINVNWRAGDLYAVRQTLDEYLDETKQTEDGAIKQRREMEFEKRWSRMFEGLNRNVSLDIDKFMPEDDK